MTDDVGMEAARFFETLGKNYFQKGWASADYNAARDLFVNWKAAIY
jgi:raffinose/stachyose/melibiose transport system substrate-binding protein